MADSSESKPDVTTTATSETNSTKPTNTEQSTAREAEGEPQTYTEMATNATTAVKDNVFSMFGGGPKKEKKEETDEGADEPSGSSKKQAVEGEEVRTEMTGACL